MNAVTPAMRPAPHLHLKNLGTLRRNWIRRQRAKAFGVSFLRGPWFETPASIVVAGEHVAISSTAVSHGNLYIGIGEILPPPQQNQLGAPPTVTPPVGFPVTEQRSRLIIVPKATTVADVARALNALGVTPRDLIAIFQALKQAGALHAELLII